MINSSTNGSRLTGSSGRQALEAEITHGHSGNKTPLNDPGEGGRDGASGLGRRRGAEWGLQ